MVRPTLEDVEKIAASGKYTCMPLSIEIFSDVRTPISVLKALKKVSEHCYMLESAEAHERWGRYSFLGFDPKLLICCRNNEMQIGDRKFTTDDPQAEIRNLLKKYRSPKVDGMPAFTGGLVGYFAYDYMKYAEKSLVLDAEDDEGFNDLDLMLFDKVIAFDHYRQKIVIIVNILLDDIQSEYERAVRELEKIKDLILRGDEVSDTSGRIVGEVKPMFDESRFCSMIEKAKHYIREGDIFQVVLSNRLEAQFEGSLFDTYRALRTLNPSPYMFYFSGTSLEAAGASPETLVKLEDGVLHTFPLAGTRPRGKTPEEDKVLEEELLKDPKELAEHSMLVDLGRNDLGKVSRFGTVKVEQAYGIHRYSHVMHIGSTVRGELREGFDALDAVDAVLPAGTLSGAPKIRACQIINELENCKRGIYGGAFGYISFTGNLDTCIGIRLAYSKNGRVFVRSGAGIVADSVPEKEYQECINKAAAVISALNMAGGEME